MLSSEESIDESKTATFAWSTSVLPCLKKTTTKASSPPDNTGLQKLCSVSLFIVEWVFLNVIVRVQYEAAQCLSSSAPRVHYFKCLKCTRWQTLGCFVLYIVNWCHQKLSLCPDVCFFILISNIVETYEIILHVLEQMKDGPSHATFGVSVAFYLNFIPAVPCSRWVSMAHSIFIICSHIF